MIDTLLEIYNLKDESRTGWELRNINSPETVAGHSWGVALLALNFMPEELDSRKVLEMSIVHDLAEAEIGDVAKRAVDVEQEITEQEKAALEEGTIQKYSNNLGEEFFELWKEYEERETPVSKFVKDMDLIDMCLQALKYEKENRYDPEEENENFQQYDNLNEFFATTKPRLNTEIGKKLFREIKSRYEEEKSG